MKRGTWKRASLVFNFPEKFVFHLPDSEQDTGFYEEQFMCNFHTAYTRYGVQQNIELWDNSNSTNSKCMYIRAWLTAATYELVVYMQTLLNQHMHRLSLSLFPSPLSCTTSYYYISCDSCLKESCSVSILCKDETYECNITFHLAL